MMMDFYKYFAALPLDLLMLDAHNAGGHHERNVEWRCGFRFFSEAGGLNVINRGWNPRVSETNSITTPKEIPLSTALRSE